MAPIRKHGGHRLSLTLAPLAAGSASDAQDPFPYDAYVLGSTSATSSGVFAYDASQEAVTEVIYVCYATLTGQATNFSSIGLQQWRAGAVLNDIRVNYSAAGVTSAAGVSVSLQVASGGTVPGAGTGVLTVATGAALPWTLQPGDMLALYRLSTGTGLATPAIGASVLIGAKGV